MSLLVRNFNVNTLENVMCRNLVSIGFDGRVFDCDFNQQLAIPTPTQSREKGKFMFIPKYTIIMRNIYFCRRNGNDGARFG